VTAYRDAAVRPGVLICSGLDPSGGAGLIADVRIANQLGTRPVGVVTTTTIQNTTGMVRGEPISAEVIREQLDLLLSDVEVAAVKIGMLGSVATANALGQALALTGAPVVWDPILRASQGGALAFEDGRIEDALGALAPHLTLVTPNARELAVLVGRPIDGMPEAIAAGMSLAKQLETAVLVKGGHLGTDESVDVLCRATGTVSMRAARVAHGEDVHGTGCALATAIAAHLAHGAELADAVRAAKQFVGERIASPVHPGRGAPAVV
jgi:hydroxymethylpyrimidine/phosphomethylpyrimidine kinase